MDILDGDMGAFVASYLSWDDYFMAVAFLSAQRSKDPNKQVRVLFKGSIGHLAIVSTTVSSLQDMATVAGSGPA